jgi:excisionase family DNA binding protein
MAARDPAAGRSATTRRVLLSPEDLAAYLGVPLATVYRWRSRREGPCGMRVGRHVRYRLEDVDRWLDARREEPT